MPDIHDFHAFTSTSSGSRSGGSGRGSGGNNSGCFVALIAVGIYLFLIMLGMD